MLNLKVQFKVLPWAIFFQVYNSLNHAIISAQLLFAWGLRKFKYLNTGVRLH